MQNIDYAIENPSEILQTIRALMADDLHAFSQSIHDELTSNVPLTQEITQHIFKTKGKQLRPLLVMLSAHAFSAEKQLSKQHYELAVVIEFVHTATLLHDDVVDHSELRRGQQTANAMWGNTASVLVGDFLYSRAFQILARHNHTEIMQVLSQATNAIAEGELLQLMNQHDADLSEENYFHVITQKTAKLFSAASEIGAILENATAEHKKAMALYGLHLGITFQLIDDALDYETSAAITGKNIGDDLRDGKATFPLIYAMQHTTPEKALLIKHAVKNGDASALEKILSILQETNAFFATRKKAREHATLAAQALQKIPESVYCNAMKTLIQFALLRTY